MTDLTDSFWSACKSGEDEPDSDETVPESERRLLIWCSSGPVRFYL